MGVWIDDFAKSDAPQFKGKNKEERREMAIAAYIAAKRGPQKESVEEARAPKMTYALVGAKDMKIYSMGSDERDLKLDRRSLEKRFKQPLKLARLKTAQSIGDKVDKSQIKENIEEATSRADLARAMAAFQKRGGKVKKVAPGKAAGYHGKDDPGKDVHGIMGRPDTKKIGTRKKVKSMEAFEENYQVNESIADHEDAANAHQMAANSAKQDLRAKKAHMSAASHHMDVIKHLNKGDRASAAMSHRAAKSQSKIARRHGNKISHSAHADTHAIRTESYNAIDEEMTRQSKTHPNLKIAVGKSAQSVKSTKARMDKRKADKQGTPLAASTVLGELSPETVKGYKKAASKSNYSAAQQYARVAASPTSRKYKNKEMDRLDNIGRKRKAGLAMADKKSVGESVNEEMMFKVSVDGLPPMIMLGRSPGDIKGQLRKIVKQPSMITDVERMTKADVRKRYRDMAKGDESIDEARVLGGAREIDTKAMSAYMKYAKAKKIDDDSIRMTVDNPNHPESKRMMRNKNFATALKMYKAAIK